MSNRLEMGDVCPGEGITEGVQKIIQGVRAHGLTGRGKRVSDEHTDLEVFYHAQGFRYDEKQDGPIACFYQPGEKIPLVKNGVDISRAVHTHKKYPDGIYLQYLPYILDALRSTAN